MHLRVRAPLRIPLNSPKAVNRAACRIESMRYGTGRGLPLSGLKPRRSSPLSALDVEASIAAYHLPPRSFSKRYHVVSQSDVSFEYKVYTLPCIGISG